MQGTEGRVPENKAKRALVRNRLWHVLSLQGFLLDLLKYQTNIFIKNNYTGKGYKINKVKLIIK